MASIVTVQSIDEDTIKVDANGRGEKTFTVTNISGSALRMGLQCQFEDAQQNDWARPRGDIERELGDQGSDQIVIDIAVPKDAAPGKYKFNVLFSRSQSPNLDFTESEPAYIEVPEPEKEAEPKPFRWWIPVTIAVVVLLIGGGVLTWLLWPSNMPDVVGKPLDEAITMLEDAGISKENIDITEETSGSVAEGEVRTQEPEAGSGLKDKDELTVFLVAEAFTKGVPDLTGKTVVEAEEILNLEGLKVGNVSHQPNSGAVGGTILRSNPAAGDRVVQDTAVDLTVVTSTIPIPNLAGQKLTEAQKALEELGLRVKVEQVESAGEALRVMSTKPAFPSSVQPGSPVTLVVVKQMITVSSLVGKTQAQAKSLLKRQNLKLGAVRYKSTNTRPAGTVISHKPARGAKVSPLSPVTLVVARKPPRPTVAARGNFDIVMGKPVDLDSGKVIASSSADMMIKGAALVRLNKAYFADRINSKSVGWDGCGKPRYTYTTISLDKLNNKYICVKTQQGKFAELRVTNVKKASQIYFARISFTTWSPPKAPAKSVAATSFSTQALQNLKVIRRELAPASGLEPEE